MKLLPCLLIYAWLLCGEGPSATQCFVSGKVVNAANSEPVRGAKLTLRRSDNPAGGSDSPAAYTTRSDDKGRFAMKGIEPGKYDFSAERTGFANTSYGARRPGREGITLSLEAGQQLNSVVFRMTAQAVVTGRILDADGDPVQRAYVNLVRYRFFMGKRQLTPEGYAGTDDLGEYRLFDLPPGRYYLQANYETPTLMMASRTVGKSAEEGYVPTYYPGTTDAGSATMIELAPGTQLRGMDFALSKSHTVTVRGHVVAPTGVNRVRTMLMLAPRGAFAWRNMNRASVIDAQGAFEISGVAPGAYNLTASVYDDKVTYSARQQIEVGNGNVEDVTLNLSTGSQLSGQINFEGQPPPSLTGINVSLREWDENAINFDVRPSGEVKEDGTFTLSNIAKETYRVDVSGLPEGYYLKSARIGKEGVKDAGIDASREISEPLQLTLSSQAGQIQGLVTNDKQRPIPGAAVVLVPEPKRRARYEAFQEVATDQHGRYAFKTVEPGEYKLFAFEDMEPGEYLDPGFLKPVEQRGSPVSIKEASRESADLTLIPAAPQAK